MKIQYNDGEPDEAHVPNEITNLDELLQEEDVFEGTGLNKKEAPEKVDDVSALKKSKFAVSNADTKLINSNLVTNKRQKDRERRKKGEGENAHSSMKLEIDGK